MDVEALLDSCKSLTEERQRHIRRVRDDIIHMHRNFRIAFDRLRLIIEMRKPGQLVVVSGPTNVGKSKLAKSMDAMQIAEARRKGLPLWGSAYVRIPSTANRRLDRGTTYRRFLESLEEPLIDRKVEYGDIRNGALPRRQFVNSSRSPTHAAMLRVLLSRLRDGHPAVFIDEAGELAQVLKVTALLEAINLFKEIADLGLSTTVLIGGPEIGPMLWFSGQLRARIKLVPVDVYSLSSQDDIKEFAGVMKGVEEDLGPTFIEKGTLCAKNALRVQEECLGTIGIALDIAIDAACSSVVNEHRPLTWQTLAAKVTDCMRDLTTLVKHEQELWEALKREELRGKFWGSWASPGFDLDEFVRPPEDSQKAAANRSKEKSDTSDVIRVDKSGGAEARVGKPGRAKPARREHRPARMPLGGMP
ncbi:AAA family ATPase [Paraburkholderia strydomiana]|uniref:hypothetical protein n=1 Tax=Paraburkholderia strydomiana TaxID=1245417 RepID=UPI0038B9DB46